MRFALCRLPLQFLALLFVSAAIAQTPRSAPNMTPFTTVSNVTIRSADLLDLLRTRADMPYQMTVAAAKSNDPNADEAELWFATVDSAGGTNFVIPSTSPLHATPVKQPNGSRQEYSVACPDIVNPEVECWFLTHDKSSQILRTLNYAGPVEGIAYINVFPVSTYDYRWKKSRTDRLDNGRPVLLEGSPTLWDKAVLEMTNLYPSHRRVVVVTQTDPPGPGFILHDDNIPIQSSDVTAGLTKKAAANTERTVSFEFDPAKIFLNTATYHVQVWVSVPLFGLPNVGHPPEDVVRDYENPGHEWRWERPDDGAISFEVHRTIGVTGDIISN